MRFFVIPLFLAIPFFLKQITLGFHPSRLHPRLSYHEAWEPPVLSSERKSEIDAILDQPYSYFAMGSQSYVFLSRDGKYVLKLPRYNRSQFWAVEAIKQLFRRNRLKSSFLEKFDKTFKAFILGYVKAPEITQIIYLHLNLRDDGLPAVDISDPLGRKWRLDLNQQRFVLQRKAEPFKKTLLAAYRAHNGQEMELLLDSIVPMLRTRASRQIRNSDPNFGPNFGFYNKQAVEIDCGNYRWRPELASEEEQRAEVERFTNQIAAWLRKNAPEYAPHFEERAQN